MSLLQLENHTILSGNTFNLIFDYKCKMLSLFSYYIYSVIDVTQYKMSLNTNNTQINIVPYFINLINFNFSQNIYISIYIQDISFKV